MSDTFPRPAHVRTPDSDDGDPGSEWIRLFDEGNEHILNLCIAGPNAGELWVNSERFHLGKSNIMDGQDSIRTRIIPND